MPVVYIKNMVCPRCITAVRNEFEKIGVSPLEVKLGEVTLDNDLSLDEKSQIIHSLEKLGFEWMDDRKSKIIEKIKNLIITNIHHQNEALELNLSDWLSDAIHQDYHSLSKLFSEVEGTTIEKYYISQKIEKVKELLIYDELSLSEIADRLHYSSVAYLSNQFKKVTGISPSNFKQNHSSERKFLDQV